MSETDDPQVSVNPYCMRCSKHLGMPFHETNEHDEAAALGQRPRGNDDRP